MPVMKYTPQRIPGDGQGTVEIQLTLLVDLVEKSFQNDPTRVEVEWGEPDKDNKYSPVFKKTGRV